MRNKLRQGVSRMTIDKIYHNNFVENKILNVTLCTMLRRKSDLEFILRTFLSCYYIEYLNCFLIRETAKWHNISLFTAVKNNLIFEHAMGKFSFCKGFGVVLKRGHSLYIRHVWYSCCRRIVLQILQCIEESAFANFHSYACEEFQKI